MFIDSELEMCDGQSAILTTAAGITKLGDHLDVRPNGTGDNTTVDLSIGEPLYLVIEVTTAFVGSGASFKFDLTTSTETALTGGTTKNIFTTGTLSVSNYTVGKRFISTLPTEDYHRYLGIRGTATGANVTAGAFNAFITKDVSNWTGSATRVPATDPAN